MYAMGISLVGNRTTQFIIRIARYVCVYINVTDLVDISGIA